MLYKQTKMKNYQKQIDELLKIKAALNKEYDTATRQRKQDILTEDDNLNKKLYRLGRKLSK